MLILKAVSFMECLKKIQKYYLHNEANFITCPSVFRITYWDFTKEKNSSGWEKPVQVCIFSFVCFPPDLIFMGFDATYRTGEENL